MAVGTQDMLLAPPRTLLLLDLVGPVEAEPAQLVGHLRGGVGGAEQTSDKGHAGSGRCGVSLLDAATLGPGESE
jgi:hypothetical protein